MKYVYIIICAFLLWIMYYFTFFIPQQAQLSAESARRTKLINQLKLETCYDRAQENYANNWNNLCEKLGLGYECLLNNSQADNLQQSLVSNRINCQNLYK